MNADDLREYHRACDSAERLGFKLVPSNTLAAYFMITPAGDELPGLGREARLVHSPTVGDAMLWMDGWRAAMSYLQGIGFTEKKRKAAEQKIRNRQLMDILKNTNQTENAIQ
jgi:hypothetical protein